MRIERTPYPVEVFTANYQAAGTFTPRGSPANFINDAEVQTISLDAATFSPLVPGARAEGRSEEHTSELQSH